MGELELAAIAEEQDGLVTRRQTRAHLSRKRVEARLANGRLIMVRWGVYRFSGVPATRWQELRAACLAAGPDAVASHRAAAELWALPGVACEQPEITVPRPMWPRLPGVRSHQARFLPADHVTRHDGVPVTTPARTLADLSSVLPAHFLGSLVHATMRRVLVRLPELRAAFHRLPSDLDRVAVRANALNLAGWTVLHFTAGTGRHQLVADVTAARARCARALPPQRCNCAS